VGEWGGFERSGETMNTTKLARLELPLVLALTHLPLCDMRGCQNAAVGIVVTSDFQPYKLCLRCIKILKTERILFENGHEEANQEETKYPVVEAIEYGNEEGLKMYCEYCKKWHHHGIYEGHRVAHCDKDTPYKETGYILKRRATSETETK
jgi:hypothetical protein